jgi:hypothetical protein
VLFALHVPPVARGGGVISIDSGRGSRIRTCDLLVPNQTRYQTALCPDREESAGFTRLRPRQTQARCRPFVERKRLKKTLAVPKSTANPLHAPSPFQLSEERPLAALKSPNKLLPVAQEGAGYTRIGRPKTNSPAGCRPNGR